MTRTLSTALSPLMVEMILCIYTGQEIHNKESPAQREAIEFFFAHNLIFISSSDGECMRWKLTEKGLHFVAMLLNTPIPVQAYVDPRTGETLELQFACGGAGA